MELVGAQSVNMLSARGCPVSGLRKLERVGQAVAVSSMSDCSPPPARRSRGGLDHNGLASEDAADGGERAQAV